MSSLVLPAIPTAMSDEEARVLTELATGKYVLEIGSLLGFSTIVLARAALWVISVDPHDGYPEADPKATLQGYLFNLKQYDVKNVTSVVGRGQDILPFLVGANGERNEAVLGHLDLAFIDTMGDYEGTKELLWLAYDAEVTTLVVHDYGHKQWTGATRAVDEFRASADWPVTVVDTLAIFN